jgi:methionine biosynthesis protein MetW
MQLEHTVRGWIREGSRVLDLGCGDGRLLRDLAATRKVRGYGLEIDPHGIALCLEAGVNVIEQDLDRGLGNFPDRSFDTVIMTQTLQMGSWHSSHQCVATQSAAASASASHPFPHATSASESAVVSSE